jgi:hypothetical protein
VCGGPYWYWSGWAISQAKKGEVLAHFKANS